MGVGVLYPVFLDLDGRSCVVVGGGRVAERKAGGLIAARARVTVVSPAASAQIQCWAEQGEARWLRRPFEAADLDGACLAFVATSDAVTNRLAADAARARGVWANVANDPEGSDFHVPAVLRKGPAVVGVSTGGASPALAAWLRDRLSASLPPGVEELAQVLGVLREITPKDGADSATAHRALLDAGLGGDLARCRWKDADEKVSRFYASAPEVAEILGRRSAETT